jgi:hypothetical protein
MMWIVEDDPVGDGLVGGTRLQKLTRAILTALATEQTEDRLSPGDMQKRLGLGPDRLRYLRDRLNEPPFIELGIDYLVAIAAAEGIRPHTRDIAILALWRTACHASRSFRTVVERNAAARHVMSSRAALKLLSEDPLPAWIVEIDQRSARSWKAITASPDGQRGDALQDRPAENLHGILEASIPLSRP